MLKNLTLAFILIGNIISAEYYWSIQHFQQFIGTSLNLLANLLIAIELMKK